MFTLHLDHHTTFAGKGVGVMLAVERQYRSSQPNRLMLVVDGVQARSRATRYGLYFSRGGNA